MEVMATALVNAQTLHVGTGRNLSGLPAPLIGKVRPKDHSSYLAESAIRRSDLATAT